MAEEQVSIIRIDTGQAVQSVNDLKENISLLKQQLGETTIGTEEYQSTLKELKVNQAALKDAMYATTASLEDIAANAKGTTVAFDEQNRLILQEQTSYNALVHTLADLKTQWRASTDEMERADIGKRINSVNDRLKEMDASVGNYQRNVGNYTGSIIDAFSRMGGGAAKVINPVKNLTTGFKALSATPVVAVMGLLASVLTKVIDSVQSSEENAGKLNEAMGGLRVIGDAVTKVFQALGAVVGTVAGAFSKAVAAITGTTEKMKERQQIAQDELALQQQQRETIVANAEAERDIAELRAMSSEKNKYTAEERLAFLKEAGDREKQISEQAMKDAKLAYEIQKAKNALTQSSAEEKRKEAEAYAAMVKAETDYYTAIRRINAGIVEAQNAEATAARNAAKEAIAAKRSQISAEKALLEQQAAEEAKDSEARLALQEQARAKQYELDVTNAKNTIRNKKTLATTLEALEKKYLADVQKMREDHNRIVEAQDLLHLKNLAAQYSDGSVEYLRAMKDVAALQLSQISAAGQLEGETVEEYNARRLTAQKTYYDAVRALNAKNAEEATAELRLALAGQAQNSEGWYAGQMQLAEAHYKNLRKLAGESDTEFAIRQAEAQQALLEAQSAYYDYLDEQDRQHVENEMLALREGSMEYLVAAVNLKKYELDTLHQLEGESNEAFRARQLAAEKDYNDSVRALAQQRLSIFEESAAGMSGLFSALADLYEANDAESEKSVKAQKALRIASATIDMISGAVAAYVSTWKSELPLSVKAIMAPVNAATVLAAGAANIAKIRSTQVSRTSTSSTSVSTATPTATAAATVRPPTYEADVQQVRTVTSAAEEERLNQMARDQRVYILSSDIEASQGAIKTRVKESTF